MAQDKVEVIEGGNVYFVYRPRVDESSPESLDDIQRLYMVMSPHEDRRYRMIGVGAKRLPQISEGGQQHWAFVETVRKEAKEIEQQLQAETYQTKTRGERTVPAARPADEGVYIIARHDGHTHLAYALELPREPDEVQRQMNIEEEASYILSVKNPQQSSRGGAGFDEERAADFPKRLQERFADRRFIEVDPPDFLDYEGAEVLFVGAEAEVPEELGIELEPERESEGSAEIFNDLRMAKSRHPVEPLFEGEWE